MATAGTDIGALRAEITEPGEVCQPGDAGYAESVRIWNAAIERRPSIVVRCSSAADVSAALGYARTHGLETSVRGGGHNYAGFALIDGGLMIDLTPMKTVTVDPRTRRATCGGGTTWGELDASTQEHGLAVTGGFISQTGVAGLKMRPAWTSPQPSTTPRSPHSPPPTRAATWPRCCASSTPTWC